MSLPLISIVALRSLAPAASILFGVLITGLFFPGSARVRLDRNFASAVQSSSTNAELLLPGKRLTRKLAGGETHLYQVQMSSEQYLKVVVEQLGIDVNVTAFAPNGDAIAWSDLAQTGRGSEVISAIAGAPGIFRFEVHSKRKSDPPASYEIRIEEQEAASALNRAANSATTLIAEANRLSDRRTKESNTQAIAKYQQALALLDESADVRMKAIVLNKIGRAYFSSGEYTKAPAYHHQALTLVRAAGDQYEEGVALTYLGDAYRLTSENDTALEYLNQAIQIWQLIQDRRGEFEDLDANIVSRITDARDRSYFQQNSFKKLLNDASNDLTSYDNNITTPFENLRKKLTSRTVPSGDSLIRAHHALAPFGKNGLQCALSNIQVGIVWRLGGAEDRAHQNTRICACYGGATCSGAAI